jgi:superfamily II DNA or RNA helicase
MPFDANMYENNEVYRSWVDHPFRFIEPNEKSENLGLRKPQLGALYTILAHLVSAPQEPATIVMPTGTGKTDTISSLILSGLFLRTLIVVPSDALRDQIADSIIALTNLRAMGAVSESVKSAVVSKIGSGLNEEEVKRLTASNVIIATPQALQNFSDQALELLSTYCSHLIFDEAHHVAAHTWKKVKKIFAGKPSLQFTATPFREDKKSLDGKIIYHYSLREAQADGYFQEIEFHPIREYNPKLGDEAVARKAIELLELDIKEGKDHILLVRTRSQVKAKRLYEIYEALTNLDLVLIHSGVKDKDKILENIKRKQYRIIICVAMLGEGFDLPELKIAAIHDQHQSPAVTLQFIGRFTRVNKKLGAAKFVANIANQRMDAQMAELYEESADWSAVIRDVSETKIVKEIKQQEFADQFKNDEDGKSILALNPSPKISARAYRLLKDDWHPEHIENFVARKEEVEYFSVNKKNNLVVLVTSAQVSVPWANTAEISNTEWFLYLAYFREKMNTLFVHCSGDDGQANNFRNLIAKDSKIIAGEKTFRTLHQIKLLKLQNVGLSRNNKELRFTMHVGRNINAIIGDLENNTAIKSNIFAAGYLDGERTNAGCSHKGKMWEMDSGPLNRWVSWCDKVAEKINDDTIEVKNIINNVMRSELISDSWPTGLFYTDWPDSLLIESEVKIYLICGGLSYNMLDVALGAPNRISDKKIEITIFHEKSESEKISIAKIILRLEDDDFGVSCGDVKISLQGERNFAEYLYENPLKLLKQDGSMIFGNYRYYSPATLNIKIPEDLVISWDWGRTKIQNESMRKEKDLDTVQGFTYQKIFDQYDIIFNDDGSGEVADLIAIAERDGIIQIDLYHCKYCPAKDGVAAPGGRVGDTYEVCGQTSRSVKWMHTGEALLSRLLTRYERSIVSEFDRMLKGDISEIDLLRYKCRDHEMILGFYIVQPAISKERMTDEQRAVLGTSYTYVKALSGTDLKVIVSG